MSNESVYLNLNFVHYVFKKLADLATYEFSSNQDTGYEHIMLRISIQLY